MEWLNYQSIWVYSESIDFRKQMNGLIDVVLNHIDQEPNDGSMYVFRNRQSTKLKLLVWDRNGYFLGYKRLKKGRFDFPVDENGRIQFTKDELFSLVSGMPMVQIKSKKQVIFHH